MSKLMQTAENIIEKLTAKGVDKAFCYVSSTAVTEFNIDNGKFSLLRTLFDNGVTINVYNQGRKGQIFINKLDDESVENAINDCIAASESSEPDSAWEIAPDGGERVFVEGCPEIDKEKLFERLVEFANDVKTRHPKVNLTQVVAKHSRNERAYANTSGARYLSTTGSYDIGTMHTASDGEKTTSFAGTGFIADNLDKPFIEMASVDSDFRDIENQIETKSIEGKFEGVAVLTQSAYGILMSAINSYCSGMSVIENTSLWKDKLGEKVCDERITVSLKPLDKRIVCGERHTAEGYISEDYDIIRNGKLNAFMMNAYEANKTGGKRSANTSGCFVVEPGDVSYEDMIKSIDRGIIVGRFSGGEPSSNGDFSGVAKNSFYVENGKIQYALAETMISGNLDKMLNNLRSISKETVSDGYGVLPYMAFNGVIISGK